MKYLKQIYSYLDSKLDSFAEKISRKTNIPKDKVMHFLTGIPIAAAVMPFGPAVSLWAVSIIAIVKEVFYDLHLGKGQFEILDAVATTAAWLPVFCVWCLL